MNAKKLKNLLGEVKSGQTSVDSAFEKIKDIPYHDLEYAKVDYHRELRNGFPEVVYSPGKSLEQVRGIVKDMIERTDGNIMATRADENVYKTIAELSDETEYYEDARIVVVKRQAFKYYSRIRRNFGYPGGGGSGSLCGGHGKLCGPDL